jgi:hypothetical protein
MKEYTRSNIVKEFETKGKKSFAYLSEYQKETFMLDKLVELTNKNIELEERVKELDK